MKVKNKSTLKDYIKFLVSENDRLEKEVERLNKKIQDNGI